jgi:hypothetical protein
MRDEKILKKLGTHDVQNASELFSMVDKCVRAAERCTLHS